MAEQSTDKAADASGKPSAIKTALVLVVILLLEGGTIAVTMYLAGGPSQVKGMDMQAAAEAEANKLVELQVVSDRFPNFRTGRNYLYDTEVFITVRHRDNEKVKAEMESAKAQITVEVATIFRKADPSWFQEPTLATLKRQIKTVMDARFGKDAEGEPMVREVLITKCIQFRSDF